MKILFFGDSITDMGRSRDVDNGNVHSYGDGFVFVVASELLSENPIKYQIVNRGNSGNRIVDLYARIKRDVWNEKPDVLNILIGVNDVWHDLGDNPNGVEITRWERLYRMMIDDTRRELPNTEIMICEPFFLHGTVTDFNNQYEKFLKIKEYAKAAKKIASDYGLTFVPLQKCFDDAAEKYGAEYYLYDGVHPAIAGAKLIANEWLKHFKKLK